MHRTFRCFFSHHARSAPNLTNWPISVRFDSKPVDSRAAWQSSGAAISRCISCTYVTYVYLPTSLYTYRCARNLMRQAINIPAYRAASSSSSTSIGSCPVHLSPTLFHTAQLFLLELSRRPPISSSSSSWSSTALKYVHVPRQSSQQRRGTTLRGRAH